MARKNVFDGIIPGKPAAEETEKRQTPPPTPEIFQSTGPVAAIRSDLRNLGARSVQEIDPELVDDFGFSDRLGDLEEDIADLRLNIADHGQQVPVLLRPHPSLSGRYQVVYGRRRLAAIRGLGRPVKALIRTLTDEEAVLAQGQENTMRKDLSFIEKTLFAGDLEAAGYTAKVIQDALNVGRGHTSHMRKVRDALPRDVIERIGPAPTIGWKRWYDAAVTVLSNAIDPRSVHAEPFPADASSDKRFSLWLLALERTQAKRATIGNPSTTERRTLVGATAGSGPIGEIVHKGRRLTFQTSPEVGEFASWLERDDGAVFRELHDRYLAELDGSGVVSPPATDPRKENRRK